MFPSDKSLRVATVETARLAAQDMTGRDYNSEPILANVGQR
jgi:hypothetical protein